MYVGDDEASEDIMAVKLEYKAHKGRESILNREGELAHNSEM